MRLPCNKRKVVFHNNSSSFTFFYDCRNMSLIIMFTLEEKKTPFNVDIKNVDDHETWFKPYKVALL